MAAWLAQIKISAMQPQGHEFDQWLCLRDLFANRYLNRHSYNAAEKNSKTE